MFTASLSFWGKIYHLCVGDLYFENLTQKQNFLYIQVRESKFIAAVAAAAADVTENGPSIKERKNHKKYQIWYTNCLFDEHVQDAFFKDQRPMGAPLGAAIILNLRKFFTVSFQNLAQHFIRKVLEAP